MTAQARQASSPALGGVGQHDTALGRLPRCLLPTGAAFPLFEGPHLGVAAASLLTAPVRASRR
jgi:hypothetical protein